MPYLSLAMEDRNRIFQKLKPPCVALSQAALALSGRAENVASVAKVLEDLTQLLVEISASSKYLDEKLADYVFFPISQVLKLSQIVSIRCLELSFRCLAILIDRGWRSSVQPRLAMQIVFLCTLMADRHPKGLASTETTDELRARAFWCLYHLFGALEAPSESREALIKESNVPQVGQTISTILDGILEGVSIDVQLSATNALQALIEVASDQKLHIAFLPGIVSKLVRILTPQTKQRRNHQVLIGCLSVLCALFRSIFADAPSDVGLANTGKRTSDVAMSGVVSGDWLQTAAAQLKSAMTNIVRLRNHSREDVREALVRLCFVVLDDCYPSLEQCSSTAIDTLLLTSSEISERDVKSRLQATASMHTRVEGLLVEAVYERLRSLTTVIHSADEQAKLQVIAQIRVAYEILSTTTADMRVLSQRLAVALRDTVVMVLQSSGQAAQASTSHSPVQSLDLSVMDQQHTTRAFSSSLVKYKTQQDLMSQIEKLSTTISTSGTVAFSSGLIRELRQSRGDMQIANMWMILQVLDSRYRHHSSASAYLHDSDIMGVYDGCLEHLYSFSLDVLRDDSEEPADHRLQSLALRALALKADKEGELFREELIEALYPVLHTMATPNELLQSDSVVALDKIATSCRYNSVRDLIIENVDYLTNAVSLRLNAFDVGPQAPQVLLMMIRLAGPSLLPYLEDTIDSIFAALENYHGYGLLVELLFRVLSVVAEEGAMAPQLAITDGAQKELLHLQDDRREPTSVSDLAQILQERATEEALGHEQETHPRRPWKELDENTEQQDGSQDAEQESEQERTDADVEVPPPAPRTYNVLFKITELTQHYLPSASPSLRGSLLHLIRITTPAIARHENSFLPLINTLWPEIVSRLDDAEPHIVASSLEIIAVLCEYAGDFMRGRVTKLWPRLFAIHDDVAKDMTQRVQPSTSVTTTNLSLGSVAHPDSLQGGMTFPVAQMRSAPAGYVDTASRLVWDALTQALTAAIRHVILPAEFFDEALEMLGPTIQEELVARTLEAVNSDAVWLARIRTGTVARPRMRAIGPRWKFVAVR